MDTLPPHAQDGNTPQKRCSACDVLFPATTEFFHRQKLGKYGLESHCKTCKNGKKKSLPKSNEVKNCTACGNEFPATSEFFYHQLNHLTSQCKACLSTKQKAQRRKPREVDILPPGEKRCTECKKVFPATNQFFNRHKRRKDGLYNQCKECKKKFDMAYRSSPELQERIKAHQNQPEVKERYKARQKAYRARPDIYTRDRALEKEYRKCPNVQKRDHEYRLKYQNTPEIRERERARRKIYNSLPEVKERKREPHRIANIAHRARKKSVQGKHTQAQIQDQLKRQKYRCYYAACGHAKFEKKGGKHIFHIEHTFPISRVAGTDIPANSIDYLVLACPSCNLSKNDKFPWEWHEGGRLL